MSLSEIKELTFATDAELEVCTHPEQADSGNFDVEFFKAGHVVEVDICGESGDYIDIQFPDGSVSAGVWKGVFKELNVLNASNK